MRTKINILVAQRDLNAALFLTQTLYWGVGISDIEESGVPFSTDWLVFSICKVSS